MMGRKFDPAAFQKNFKAKIKIIQNDVRKKYVTNNTKQTPTRPNESM